MSDSRSDRRAVGPALLTAGMMAYWRVTPASALLKPVAGAALPDRLLPLLFAGTVLGHGARHCRNGRDPGRKRAVRLMPIRVRLAVLLAERNVKSKALAETRWHHRSQLVAAEAGQGERRALRYAREDLRIPAMPAWRFVTPRRGRRMTALSIGFAALPALPLRGIAHGLELRSRLP